MRFSSPSLSVFYSLCGRISLAAAVTILLAVAGPAHAEDTPFQLETSDWVSFDRYKNEPSAWHEQKDPAAPAQVEVPTIPTGIVVPQAIALPILTRPVDAPILPGVASNAGAATSAKTDDDDDDQPVLKRPVSAPELPGISKDAKTAATDSNKPPADVTADTSGHVVIEPPPQNNWKNAMAAAQQAAQQKQYAAAENGSAPGIRLSYLPNSEVTPSFATMHKVRHSPKPQEVAQTPIPTPAQTPVEKAACAAIDAYKKREIAAIESDRKTLANLQSAIQQLGLQKQLDFLVDANGNAIAHTQDAKMDFPPGTAPSPVKN
jgi:hypothetical protein